MPPATTTEHGPLAGLRVLEIASLAPAPFACTMLSDLGADVLRIDRGPAEAAAPPPSDAQPADAPRPEAPSYADPLSRGRRSIAVDLKQPDGAETVLRLVERADVLIEGFRPGVCERLGIGPEPCLARNPRLVYTRLTGYGQDGPMAQRAGHDINYLALAGALEPLGPPTGPPLPPLNYVADFGGGGMLAVVGILAALWERERSGTGQVVDASMVDGAAMITSVLHTLRGAGLWDERRGRNLFDGSAPFYAAYECSDSRFVAVGALEPQFWAELLDKLAVPDAADLVRRQHDRDAWPEIQARLAAIFRSRARDEWAAFFADSDACVTPVLGPFEAHEHPHNAARETFVEVFGYAPQPAPAPRFSRTPGRIVSPSPQGWAES
ncbi:MAG TPA: CaiB/BaiF CoA-transferase family protein [Actinospica sp.]|nr:CaiB/BaiF CoA-transferase family protein [Actinospica sp.]